MNKAKEKNGLLFNLLLITIFWNIWFPKAGIKLSGIPLTIGNIFFAFTFIIWLLCVLKRKKLLMPPLGGAIMLGIMYFLIRYVIILISQDTKISEVIGYIIPLCVYPLIFFITYSVVDNKEKLEKVIKLLIYGFFFLCLYAFAQYIFGIDKVCIPGLTVNLTDYKEMGQFWYMQKSNGTDISNAKIVGTYQNGNLFGISLLLIYPIVYNYFKSKNKNSKLIISLLFFIITTFLTLSRACWLGVALFITFGILLENEKTKASILRKMAIIVLSIVVVICVFELLPSVANRFFGTKDWTSMSGRTEGLIEVFSSIDKSNNIFAYIFGPYGIVEYSGLAYEILPLSLFVQTGIIGLLLLYYAFFSTYIRLAKNNYVSKGIRLSLIIWLIVGCIECGYWLPPAALNLFAILSLGLKAKEIYNTEDSKWKN